MKRERRLLAASDILTRPGRCSPCHVIGVPRSMRTATPARKAFSATPAFVAPLAAIDLRLRAGDERGQAVDAIGNGRLRLRRLVLLMRPMVAMIAVFAFAALLTRLLLVAIALMALAHIRLRLLLLRRETGLLTER